ncbi:ferritin-like domain-containing protein [Flavobacterium sp. JP2137]|uniref:YciE/YciF ferroxidase family protein n=1 Tax=Flavobacterium sp. JP2137 TaxID=3414510 RepID=UPI003D2FEBAF
MEKKTTPKKNAAKNLAELFEDSLQDMFWAEQAILKGLDKMKVNATSSKLQKAIEKHHGETQQQLELLERVFESLELPAKGKKCEAMAGILEEGNTILKETEEGAVRDSGIIAACQKVEHYEIATYGTLIAYAKTLKYDEASKILMEILEQEKKTDEDLSKLATSEINGKADA